jgi:hypothetical protein
MNKAIIFLYNDVNGSSQNRINSGIEQNAHRWQSPREPPRDACYSISVLASSHCVANFRAPEGGGGGGYE